MREIADPLIHEINEHYKLAPNPYDRNTDNLIVGSNVLAIIGSDDPEARYSVRRAHIEGVSTVYARMPDGRRVSSAPSETYAAARNPELDVHEGDVVTIECEIPGFTPDLSIDHHHGRYPDGYEQMPVAMAPHVASLGQFTRYLGAEMDDIETTISSLDQTTKDTLAGKVPAVDPFYARILIAHQIASDSFGTPFPSPEQVNGINDQIELATHRIGRANPLDIADCEIVDLLEQTQHIEPGYPTEYLVNKTAAAISGRAVLMHARDNSPDNPRLRVVLLGSVSEKDVQVYEQELVPRLALDEVVADATRGYATGYPPSSSRSVSIAA